MVKGKLLLVDDELHWLEGIILDLKADGYEVDSTYTIKEAQEKLSSNKYDLVVLDVMMPLGDDDLPFLRGASIMDVGVHFAAEVRRRHPDLRIIIYSQSEVRALSAFERTFQRDTKTKVLSKSSIFSFEFVEVVNLMMADKKVNPKIFIVHGHDGNTLLELKDYLQNTLSLPKPIILAEQKSGGQTIIEKFEQNAAKIDVAFILLTPDDIGAVANTPKVPASRARQNVVFELGYFMGMLGRKSGRVIVLFKGPLEIASDLAGVVYIDISNGVKAAGEEIRRELSDLL